MRWNDVEEICEALQGIVPAVDPRGMSDNDIVKLVTALPGFADERTAFNAGHIEAIRGLAWWGS